jgi:hypothetical protein
MFLEWTLTSWSRNLLEYSCSSNQNIPYVLWHPKIDYSVDKSPPLVSILSQLNPAHKFSTRFFKIHFNIIPPPHLIPCNSLLVCIFYLSVTLFLRYSRYSDWLRTGRLKVRSSSPGKGKVFSSPRCPDRFWGPPSLLSNGYRWLFP